MFLKNGSVCKLCIKLCIKLCANVYILHTVQNCLYIRILHTKSLQSHTEKLCVKKVQIVDKNILNMGSIFWQINNIYYNWK